MSKILHEAVDKSIAVLQNNTNQFGFVVVGNSSAHDDSGWGATEGSKKH
jgi:hypothetical protein